MITFDEILLLTRPVTNISYVTYGTCHQNIFSAISVTNIDLTQICLFASQGQNENQSGLETLKRLMNQDLRVIDIGETVSAGSNERLLSGLG